MGNLAKLNTLWAMAIVLLVAVFTTAAIIKIVHLTEAGKINWNR